MKYLDEGVKLTVTGLNVPKSGVYQYKVFIDSTNVFYGNTYIAQNQTSKTIDITDILSSYYWNSSTFLSDHISDSGSILYGYDNANIVVRAEIVITYLSSAGATVNKNSNTDVALIYRYPNRKNRMYNLSIQPASSTNTECLFLQGYNYMKGTFELTPRYPYMSTDNYPFYYVFQSAEQESYDERNYYINFEGAVTGQSLTENWYAGSNAIIRSLNDLYRDTHKESETDSYIYLTRADEDEDPRRVFNLAKIDACPADYYLMWQDRYGSIQSQPFNKRCTYTEKVDTTEITTYDNKRLVNCKTVQPSWEINSDWLSDHLYPYYESIYISPFLLLFDTKENKSYQVILKDSDYKEKTFKNESKQLFNLTLNLEAIKTQNMLY